MAVVEKFKPLLPMLPPCRVCGDKASGFHYGANTCEGCKVFFRRSLKRQTGYRCSAEQQCPVITGSRNSCQYCRFSKCIRVGMSRSAIRHGRYTHTTRTKNILEVKHLEKIGRKRTAGDVLECEGPAIKREAMSPPPFNDFDFSVDCKSEYTFADDVIFPTSTRKINSGVALFSASLTNEKKHYLTQCIESVQWASETFGLPETSNCMKTAHSLTPSVSPQTFSSFGDSLSTCSSQSSDCNSPPYCLSPSIISDVPDQPLSPDLFKQDLEDIAQELNPLLEELPDSVFYSEQSDLYLDEKLSLPTWPFDEQPTETDAQKWLNQTSAVMEGYVNFCKILPGFSQLTLTDQAALIKGARSEVLLVQSQSFLDIISGELHSSGDKPIKLDVLMSKLNAEQSVSVTALVKRLRDMMLTRAEQGLLVGILTTSADRPEMELGNKDAVEKLNAVLIEAMQMSVNKNHPKNKGLFAKLMQLLTDLRSHSHYSRDLLRVLLEAEPELRVNSMLMDIFQD